MVASTFGLGLMELILLFGFPSDLPVGLPPRPEDPKVLASAPDDCLFFLSWAGAGTANADSSNGTERLLADPEIRRSIDDLKARVKAAIRQGAGTGEKSKAVAEDVQTLAEIVLTSPTALFVDRFSPSPLAVDVSSALAIGLGDRAAAFEKAWKSLESTLGQTSDEETDGDVAWHILPGPKAVGIDGRWTVAEGYFVLAFGKETGPKTLTRMNAGKPAGWLKELRQRLPVKRMATVSYLNAERLTGLLSETLNQFGPEQAAILEKLELKKIHSFGAVSGLDDAGFVSRGWVKMDSHPAIFLKLLDGKPLTLDDLKPIPADATIAAAVRFDPDRTLKEFASMVETLGARPGTADEIFREFDQLSSDIGFSLREDLLPALGDSWRIYCSPSEGGALFTNWTAVVSVRNPKKLADIATVLTFKAREARRQQKELMAGTRGRFVSVEQRKSGPHEISFLNFAGDEAPIAPAWCFTGRELVLSTFPQGVHAYVSRDKNVKSLADLPDVVAGFKDGAGPHVFARFDTPTIARMVYPLVLHFGNLMFGELQREGLDFHISMLPALPALLKHLQPGSSSVSVGEDGVEFVSRRTLPVSVGSSGLLLPAAAFFSVRSSSFSAGPRLGLLDAFSPTRAVLSVSKNNLKQIGLAMHNFHDAHGRFPPALTVNGDGKPLLSWRVQILPFIEEQALFNEFHQDEPWDSPHNKRLIAKMPKTFLAPGSKAGEGKTNYLTIRGDSTVFPGKETVEIRNIIDGTSNTIMVVEVNDDSAVTWTKPDDLPLDDKAMMKALGGFRSGGFLAGFADGSVRQIPQRIDVKTVKNLFLINDGNVIPSLD